MPFALRTLKEDLDDGGSNFDDAPDPEFRLATRALEPGALANHTITDGDRTVPAHKVPLRDGLSPVPGAESPEPRRARLAAIRIGPDLLGRHRKRHALEGT